MANKSHRVEITIAVLGLIGVLGAAVIGNWDKLFPNHDGAGITPEPQPPREKPNEKPKDAESPANDSSKPSPSGFRVVEAILRADPFEHNGPCPVTITFSGRISVVGGIGTVSYKF